MGMMILLVLIGDNEAELIASASQLVSAFRLSIGNIEQPGISITTPTQILPIPTEMFNTRMMNS